MNKWGWGIALGVLLTGCANQRTALREPDNRWALATWPASPAPIDLHAQPIPGFSETVAALWVSPLTSVVFVTAPGTHLRHPRLQLAKAGQIRLAEARALDLYCPQPLWIHTGEGMPTAHKQIRLLTAEARIFR